MSHVFRCRAPRRAGKTELRLGGRAGGKHHADAFPARLHLSCSRRERPRRGSARCRPGEGAPPKDGLLGAIVKSLTGDVYAEPFRWRELSGTSFFTEGWEEAWVSPVPGGGGAPRQGGLNSFDGVFYVAAAPGPAGVRVWAVTRVADRCREPERGGRIRHCRVCGGAARNP